MKDYDWSLICNQIRATGISMTAVGRQVGSDWTHMNRLARGEVNEPKYSVGVKILAIHKKVMKEKELEQRTN